MMSHRLKRLIDANKSVIQGGSHCPFMRLRKDRIKG